MQFLVWTLLGEDGSYGHISAIHLHNKWFGGIRSLTQKFSVSVYFLPLLDVCLYLCACVCLQV